jgi:hypothetical protein
VRHRLAYHHTWLLVSRGRNLFSPRQVRIVHNEVSNGHAAVQGRCLFSLFFSWNLGCFGCLYLFLVALYSTASLNFRQRCLCYLCNFSAPQKLKGSAPRLTMYFLFQFLHLVRGETIADWNTGAKLAPDRWWVWMRGCLSWRRRDLILVLCLSIL